MVPALCATTEIVPPPAYHRAVATRPRSQHIDALTLVTTLRLFLLPASRAPGAPDLPAAVTARTGWRAPSLSGGVAVAHRAATHAVAAVVPGHARLVGQLAGVSAGLWAARGCARGAPCAQCLQMWKRAAAAGAPPCEMLLVVAVRAACASASSAPETDHRSARRARLATRGPDAVYRATPRPSSHCFLRGYRVHAVVSGLGPAPPLRLAPANPQHAPFAASCSPGGRGLWAASLHRAPRCRHGGLRLIDPDPDDAGCGRRGPWNPSGRGTAPAPPTWTAAEAGKRTSISASRARLPVFGSAPA